MNNCDPTFEQYRNVLQPVHALTVMLPLTSPCRTEAPAADAKQFAHTLGREPVSNAATAGLARSKMSSPGLMSWAAKRP